jgi:ubiquitin-activating enzyme E1
LLVCNIESFKKKNIYLSFYHFCLFLPFSLGKIIPAVATTTCSVTGLVSLELYKIASGRAVEDARNTFMNLANNVYAMSEPVGPKRTKSVENDPISMGPVRALPEGFTRWDRVKIHNSSNITPLGLASWLEANQDGIRLSMISYGRSILYNPLLYRNHAATRGNRPIRDIVVEISGKPIDKQYLILDVSCEDDAGDVVIPPIEVRLD